MIKCSVTKSVAYWDFTNGQECFTFSASEVCGCLKWNKPVRPRPLANCSSSSTFCLRISISRAISSSLCFIAYKQLQTCKDILEEQSMVKYSFKFKPDQKHWYVKQREQFPIFFDHHVRTEENKRSLHNKRIKNKNYWCNKLHCHWCVFP